MAKFISPLSVMQNEEWISKLESTVSDESSEQQFARCRSDLPTDFFNTSCLLDTALHYVKQQEKKRTDICEIIQILRMTKLQQCRGKYYDNGKFCALGAIMHEKYGWNGSDNSSLGYGTSVHQQMATILGNDAVVNKIISLNDYDGKSFSEIADWLEKNLFTELNWTWHRLYNSKYALLQQNKR